MEYASISVSMAPWSCLMPHDIQPRSRTRGGNASGDPSLTILEIASDHIADQHGRLQEEIYVRLRSRSELINYAIAATAGLAAVVAFVFPENSSTIISEKKNIGYFLIVSLVLYTASFTRLGQ
jgi:hypothetical protein